MVGPAGFGEPRPRVYLKSRKFSLFLQTQRDFALKSLGIHKGFPQLFALNPACVCEISVIFFVFKYTLKQSTGLFLPGGTCDAGHGLFKFGLYSPAVVRYNKKRCSPFRGCILVGPAGFEPTQWRSQSPLPYRLATAQQKKRPRSIITVRSLVGCLERFELSASRATIWRANQLRHRHHRMRPKGLEPLAHCLEGSCSIHLSYGRARVSSCCWEHAV